MSLVSVVSIVPAGKEDSEYRVALSADGQNPPTHWGKHSWEPAAPVAKAEEILQARVDSFAKRETLKQQLPDAEKTGLESFRQLIASMGLQIIVAPDPDADPKGGQIDTPVTP